MLLKRSLSLIAILFLILLLASTDWWAPADNFLVRFRGPIIVFLCVVGYFFTRSQWNVPESVDDVDER